MAEAMARYESFSGRCPEPVSFILLQCCCNEKMSY